MKSIKQISEETRISKVSLYKFIKKNELKNHIVKENKTTFISEIGENIIKEYYSRQRLATLNDILNDNLEEA